jgi:hypothetical protein
MSLSLKWIEDVTMSPEAERAELRIRYCRRELERALHNHDSRDPQARGMLRKLEEDLERAESDLAHALKPRDRGLFTQPTHQSPP